jgi:hypothetical protein
MEIPAENDFKRLLASLLFDSLIESQKKTPIELRKAGRQTGLSKLKSIRHQFCTDIDRILSEMDLAIALFSTVPSDEYLLSLGSKKTQYFVFLLGAFLNLVHQAKDKLFRLIYSLNFDNYKNYHDNAENIKVPNLSKVKSLPISKTVDILRELNNWNDESKSKIGAALRLRTQHHHRASKIPLSKDLQMVDFEIMTRAPLFSPFILEEGKNI